MTKNEKKVSQSGQDRWTNITEMIVSLYFRQLAIDHRSQTMHRSEKLLIGKI